MTIHPTAIVDPSAKLGQGVEVGAYAFIGPHVEIGDGSKIQHHASVDRLTRLGAGCMVAPFAALGGDPQDLKYHGEPTTLETGDNCLFREFVTVNRGTGEGGGVTRIGNNCLLMAYAHVAHDCQIGDNVVMANCATLGGHVTLEDRCNIGGLVAVHQFTRIGTFCFVGGASGVSKDLPPYTLCEGNRAISHGLNVIGLKRAGFADEAIETLKQAYRIIFRTRTPLADALAQVRAEVPQTAEVRRMLEFIESSKRGVSR
ncbi:acyl-(acyl-carrier-protein)--UDP-N-acetylglucosa mineO-acyltransferase [Desulfarculus baarsii DSM 2075]|uniref:Acyl-[acyl-carrier-protein]--UDP-N-acetylglucosamine O-acyltransferase n=1 Tax=Desulfarculus baarsii (strain ATCC 33931 / DSM 2075 / LMG 7858 / VKM B-1802 / 2st14) TaxID=644282 RepID=E1QIF3_DESB2|nr:acyl-ACP--UDP-N-acetylglucosamine O-acyltransferase [Desulfarculus baarsii]ADK85470.1 acyl-(acyl-carrier-protein)--UDP-N-acetylglucosa mineO-acyltransferase [Desulfarculus baarsii DSM 2075]